MKTKLTKLYNGTKIGIAKHIVDSTALVIATTPAFAILETNLAGITEEQSIHARLIGLGVTYLGMGIAYTEGMRISRKKFNIQKEDTEKIKKRHDRIYTLTTNTIASPLFYLAAGVRDLKEMAIGTACGIGLAAIFGGPMGRFIDNYGDLIGTGNSGRLPNLIKNKSRPTKLGLAGLLAGASFGLTAGVYELNSYLKQHYTPRTETTQVEKTISTQVNYPKLIFK